MTTQNRSDLIDSYCQASLECMSGRDLERFFLDVVAERLEELSDEELQSEVSDFNPELLQS